MMRREENQERKSISTSVKTGAIALVFLIIGFQTALFIYRASVVAIVNKRDRPDTVYVVDRHIAESLLLSSGISDCVSPAVALDGQAASANVSGQVKGKREIVIRKSSVHSRMSGHIYASSPDRKIESFRFNPNTVSHDDLVRLGFSSRQAQSILNYREKGGHFSRKEDFAESYVVSDSIFKRLEKYIDIPLTDINLADSAAFDALPGIGGYFAAKMVEYRKRLGGSYSFKEQLMDIWKFDEEKFRGLEDLIALDTAYVKPYRLWTLPEDSLKTHPYIGKYSAHGIVLFRENHPERMLTIENLLSNGIIRADMAEKLSRCHIAAP